ncbi:uncharacterized protein LOC120344676 [Styela clava]
MQCSLSTMAIVCETMQKLLNTIEDDIRRKTMNDDIRQIFECISKLHSQNSDQGELLGDKLSHHGGGEICVDYLKALSEDGRNTPTDGYEAECLQMIKHVCWNYSDASLKFAAELGITGLFPILVTELTTFEHKLNDSIIRDTIILPSLSILHNCAKVHDNKKYFNCAKALDAVLRYASVEDQHIKMVAMLTLAYITEEDGNGTDKSVFDFILMNLKHCMDDVDHKYRGFSAEELVYGIMKLASNDDNKLQLVKQGVLPVLVQLLQKGNSTEKEVSARTVWILSFRNENKPMIRKERNMMQMLKELAGKPGEAKESATGALWVLQPKIECDAVGYCGGSSGSDKGKTQKHVMISYQWKYQKLALKIKDRLGEMNYRVWIDVESMGGGSLLDTMAKAVENSAVVLICMSSEYKQSPNCRTEGDYAYKLRTPIIPIRTEVGYKPDGWLGALIGSKYYYDFSNPMVFDAMFSKLVEELGNNGKCDEQDGPKSQDAPKSQDGPKSIVEAGEVLTNDSPCQKTKSVNIWTKIEVSKWATENQIKSQEVQNLNGESIVFLNSLRSSAPEFFYKYISKKLGVTELPDLMAFCGALENLE